MAVTPSISFLLCTRNRAEIAHDCIISLLNSDREDIEVIVRDNCSSDNTVELIQAIEDSRLKIYVAPENQGTLSFFEISKLASGDIITWLSDEDNFQFNELDFVLSNFKSNINCNVMFGSIIVGRSASKVMFPDEVISDPKHACLTALSFSGCGGLFIRRSALFHATSYNPINANDAYCLWNYYPVGFFASRCVTHSLVTTSRVLITQSRFAQTTNNWSAISSKINRRPAHYYPESVLDRLCSNIANVYFKPFPKRTRLQIVVRLVRLFHAQSTTFSSPIVHNLLLENYDPKTVSAYLDHIKSLQFERPVKRAFWFYRKTLSLLWAAKRIHSHWRRLRAS